MVKKIKKNFSKEILILSVGHFELSTENVMDWLITHGYKPIRVNGEDLCLQTYSTSLHYINKLDLNFKGRQLKSAYHSIWFRRWSSFEDFSEFIEACNKVNLNTRVAFDLSNHRISNSNSISDFILSSIQTKIVLTSNKQREVNKLNVLLSAKNSKLEIPRFIITNNKADLVNFKQNIQSDLVTKVINSSFSYFTEENSYMLYTELITDKVLNEFNENFPITFFQEFIDKVFDLRVFYLDTKLYCAAILSQRSINSKIDCRKGNQFPNRRIPYKLPSNIEKKIKNLMKILGLEMGLLDLVKSINGKYYFLEINPVGQFNDISKSCNYPIESDIANYLINGKQSL